mmetsp:Transcript_15907/g.22117  ORF Transcript_15907/g.22117 Transcript_15907/m.22117 type:complete len:93 (+) Transcript_15907:297-575(+)
MTRKTTGSKYPTKLWNINVVAGRLPEPILKAPSSSELTIQGGPTSEQSLEDRRIPLPQHILSPPERAMQPIPPHPPQVFGQQKSLSRIPNLH